MGFGFCFVSVAGWGLKELLSDHLVKNAPHWKQLHIITSGQQMLPRATAVMGNKQRSLKTNFENLNSSPSESRTVWPKLVW